MSLENSLFWAVVELHAAVIFLGFDQFSLDMANFKPAAIFQGYWCPELLKDK
jgi:hypothetical protein